MALVSLGLGTLVALVAIVLVSYFTNQPNGSSASSTTSTPSSALVGTTLRSFTLPGLNGGTVTAPWATGHPAVVIFFASYCGPCRSEMPKVAVYVRTHHEGNVRVLGVDASDQRGAAQSFVRRDGVGFPVGFDPNDTVTSGVFRFQTIPESVFVTARGVVTKVYFGAIPTTQLSAGLAALRASS